MFWNKIADKINDKLDTIKTTLDEVSNKVDCMCFSEEDTFETYDDNDDEIEELKTELSQKQSEIDNLRQQLKEQLEVNNKYLQDYKTTKGMYDTVYGAYKNLTKKENDYIELSNKLTNQLAAKDEVIDSLKSSLAAVCGRKVDETIELFALKTYRGWECLYHDGDKINLDKAKSVTIDWSRYECTTVNIDRG